MSPLRNNFIERLQLKGFTERTVCSYVSIVADLSRFTGKSPLAATSDTIQSYLVHLVKQRHLSARSVNLHIAALKTFYRAMSKLFRGKVLAFFKKAVQEEKMLFPGMLETYRENPSRFQTLLDSLYAMDWVTYAKAPFAGPQAVLKYLGRYSHRIAISNSRLVELTKEHVSFRWKNYADGNKSKVMKLKITEFIRRFLLHVLPQRFVRIRYYGFLSVRNRGVLLPLCMKLLGKEPAPVAKAQKPHWDETIKALTGKDPLLCPQCGQARMKLREVIPKQGPREHVAMAA